MNTEPESLLQLFRSKGALLHGHFQLSSGKHSPDYFQCARILQYPQIAAELGRAIAERITEPISAVVSPALGGVIIGHEVAKALSVRALFTEREDNQMQLRRGFYVSPDEPVLVVEDVLTTGKSSLEVVRVIETLGARVSAIASIVDRSVERIQVGCPAVSLVKYPLELFEPNRCPLCEQDIPLVKPGSRKMNGGR